MSPRWRFRPKSLKAESLEAPMDPRWKIMGPEEEKRLHEKRLEEHRRFRPLGPRTRRRFLRLGGATTLVFVAIGFLFVGRVWWAYPVVGFLLGLVVTFLRPPDMMLAILYGGAGFVVILGGFGWHVGSGLEMLLLGFGTVIFTVMGWVVGMDEDLRRLDGED